VVASAKDTTYTLEGTRFATLEGFFAEVGRVLIPGATWGHNLDAFDDILRGGFGTPTVGFTIVWRDAARSRRLLGYPETIRQLERRLARSHPSNRARVAVELDRARHGEGPTVFDWLTTIIAEHDDIALELR
jgi:RNAse (barnase) inhibitor barstar